MPRGHVVNTPNISTPVSPIEGTRLRARARQLAWATVAWNVVEALVAIIAGTAAGSAALVGFGLDSTIEVASALVIIWQFSGLDEQRERRALRMIAISFFALAAYVSARAILDLSSGNEADTSTVGIALAIAVVVRDAGSRYREAANRTTARIGHGHRRQPTDMALHLPVSHPARGTSSERHRRLVVG